MSPLLGLSELREQGAVLPLRESASKAAARAYSPGRTPDPRRSLRVTERLRGLAAKNIPTGKKDISQGFNPCQGL